MKNEKVNGHRIKCYDNGGRTMDRYSVVYMDSPEDNGFMGIGMSEHPSNPQGFGQHGTFVCGKHLGKRIAFKDLPPDCQDLVYGETALI
jgi:hypothetical protein